MSAYRIDIANEQGALLVDEEQLRRAVRHVLRAEGAKSAAVSVALVDSEAIRALKRTYFDRDEATDVISFNLGSQPRGGLMHTRRRGGAAAEAALECEIVANPQRALETAPDDPEAELVLYVVHGLLHQLGYDDATAAAARTMHQREDQLLDELGYGKVYSERR